MIPPYVSGGYDFRDISDVVYDILTGCFYMSLSWIYPLFQVIPIILIVVLFAFGNRVRRVFDLYAAISYVLFAFLQSIAFTEEFSLGIMFNNIVILLIVAAFWFWETLVGKNDFTYRRLPLWRYWVVPLALLAFWLPVNMDTFNPDLSPLKFFTSGSGLAFCMMTPVYIALLSLFYPRVNIATLRVTSLAGMIIGAFNVLSFFFGPENYLWMGILHLPLLVVSVYGFVLSMEDGRLKAVHGAT
jgi:hypothetical protein